MNDSACVLFLKRPSTGTALPVACTAIRATGTFPAGLDPRGSRATNTQEARPLPLIGEDGGVSTLAR